MKQSFKLMTVFDIPIEINYTWFIIFGLVLVTLAQGFFPLTNPGNNTFIYWAAAMLATLLLFGSLLLHELSHSYVAKRNKLPIKGITLFVFGGVAHLEREPQNPNVELKMAIAGPICSIALSIFFYSLTVFFKSIGVASILVSMTYYLFIINLFVAIFNMIPGFPLDGGRVLRALIWKYTNNIRTATRIASNIGKGVAIALMGLGILQLFGGAFVAGVWLIFIGLFLMEAAQMSYKQLVFKKALVGMHVYDIMSQNVITAPSDLTITKLIDEYFFRFRHASFPVIEDDKIIGVVTLHDIKEIPKEKWSSTIAGAAMRPLSARLTTSSHSTVASALQLLATNGLGRALVMEDGKLLGIVSQKDIAKLFQMKEDLEQ
ncbi:MAG: site-2 protease family protein [Candidatus Margulisbacteria bacterium]|nr:site-2 protease family protein [Candidatus Margulisiibacteriota bacterium]MBU1022292.1 site-2 protease family protein [Candidatus Margulisiibacteriota bacterium]MBU1729905.1 site-2 protease family protein [Candidatus Margulisiibacteriota bacterium]MBU1955939.1 site-2 protease family protein [Candidatus Margulisiibacteriota bacterium]